MIKAESCYLKKYFFNVLRSENEMKPVLPMAGCIVGVVQPRKKAPRWQE